MAEADAPPDGRRRADSTGKVEIVSAREVVERSVGGAAKTALAGLVGRGAGLATTLVVTHFVTRSEYGNANLAMIVATIANSLTLLSPQQALLTRNEHYERTAQIVRFYAAWSGVVVGALLLVFGRRIVTVLGQPEATPLLWVYCAALVLERVGVIPTLALRYRLNFGAVARMDLMGDTAYVLVTLGTVVLGAGGFSLALGMVARQAMRLCMLVAQGDVPVWPGRSPWGPTEKDLAREVFHYSWPIHLAGTGDFLTLYLDNVMVGKLYKASSQGLYAVAYTLMMSPTDTIAMYGATAMVRALGLRDGPTRRNIYLQGLRYVSVLLFPIAICAALLSSTLEQALLPPRWHGIAPIVVGLCPAAMSLGVMRMAFAHLTAIHRTRAASVIDGSRLLVFVLALGLVAVWDRERDHLPWISWGVSVAFTASALSGLLFSLYADELSLRRVIGALAPPALGTLFMGACLWGLQEGLGRLGLQASVGRLLFEGASAVGFYVAYFRVCHGAIYREATGWVSARLRPR